jgi:hypothetical protein
MGYMVRTCLNNKTKQKKFRYSGKKKTTKTRNVKNEKCNKSNEKQWTSTEIIN